MVRTRSDRRTDICRLVGANQATATCLTKPVLNSLIAYLTGEFDVKPGKLYAEGAPSRRNLKVSVANTCRLDDYLKHTVAQDDYGLSDRDFNNAELDAILEAMDERGDQREWVG